MVTEVLIKLLFTGLLGFIIWLCAQEIWHIWIAREPVLTAYTYIKDGQASKEDGLHFAQLVSHDLKQVELTHRRYYATIKDILTKKRWEQPQLPPSEAKARTDHRDPETLLPESVDLPEIVQALPELEIQVYGVDLSAILRRLRRWIRQPNEITGSVSERKDNVTVYSEMHGSSWAVGKRWYTFISDQTDKKDASFTLACSIFRMLAREQVHPIYATASDDDFVLFIKALRQYESYQNRLTQGREREAQEALAASRKLIERVKAESEFPFLHDLVARVLYDVGEDAKIVKEHLDRYLIMLKEHNLPEDPTAKSLIERLENKIASAVALAQLPIRTRIRPVTPGASIASANATAGTLCCIVQDENGQKYLLSADHTFGGSIGDVILQPGPFDGGRDSDIVGHLWRLIPASAPGPNLTAGAIARVVDEVEVSNEIPGVGKIMGLANSVKAGDEVKIVGRTSALAMGKVGALNVSVNINIASRGLAQFRDLIMIDPISRGGDSGAPVLTKDNKLVGMIYAGGAEATFVMPIERILEEFNVTLSN